MSDHKCPKCGVWCECDEDLLYGCCIHDCESCEHEPVGTGRDWRGAVVSQQEED